jgi:hypothetical protein
MWRHGIADWKMERMFAKAAGSWIMANPQLLMAGYGLEDRANVSLYGLLSKHKILYCVEVQ